MMYPAFYQIPAEELGKDSKVPILILADSGEVHSVHMDSCEDRLESLKVLYDAGILDREEYAQRVARVKQAHAQSRGEAK